jgi:hypothetical protein
VKSFLNVEYIMKKYSVIIVSIFIYFVFFSCQETIEPKAEPPSSPASNIVINELFKIDSTKYYAHWWLELYNPTGARVNMYKWKLVFKNSNYTYNFIRTAADTTFYLEAGRFFVLLSDHSKTSDFWVVGALTTELPYRGPLAIIKPTDEVSLIDSAGKVVSMLRYGNYVIPANDPYPNNKSFGDVSEWHSICRYADPKGAWETGNSRNDFFEEESPIVGYYSQRYHPK